ncbi:S9 family peptidase [bacterium]|nr:S9 family peptidase [bacterium]
MRKILAIFALVLAFLYSTAAKEISLQPPVAKKIPKTMSIHGDTRVDDYYWMRERENPEVKAYLSAENAYADAMMKPTAPLQEKLYKEILSHIKETDMSVPNREGDYFYYSRTEQGKQYYTLCRKKGNLDAAEEVLMDVNKLAEGQKFMSVGLRDVSPDGNLMAYATDTTGFRDFTLHIMDLRTGKTFADKVERVSSFAWAADNKTMFYTTTDPAKRSYRIFRHVLGSDQYELMFEEKDEMYRVYTYLTNDQKYVFFGSGSSETTEYKYLHADKPMEAPKLILPRENKHEYYPDIYKGILYIMTNKDAKNFRVVTAPLEDPSPKNWKDFISHNKAVFLEGLDFFENHCVISERENGLPWIRIIDFRNQNSHRIEMPEPVFSAYVGVNLVFNTNILRIGYQSFVTPSSVYDYHMDARQKTLLKQYEVPGGFDSANYVSERIYATAKDGVKVPVSLVYRKGMKKDGTAPLLLSGYGAYGAPIDIYFDPERLVLLDRGVIYAEAHIRGGGDLGKEWYEQGKMMNKKNTFTDYIAVAEHLIAEKYTAKDRLVATGGSAGGLLMGAITNMRPDLFRAVVNYVPYVDVINTMLDPTIPLVVPEYPEWGNPNEKDAYFYMKSYSPYDNISKQNYPAILVRTSFYDSQVMYWEPAKYVARLRANKTDKNVLLFKVALEAGGHGGQSGRYDSMRDDAFDYAFILTQVRITN